MGRPRVLAPTLALLLLAALPLALAHGDEMPAMNMGAMTDSHSTPAHNMSDFEYNPSYFHYTKHASLMNAHIALTMVSWVIVLPIAVMFSIARSRYTILAQTSFLVINGLGVLTGIIYNMSTPDLYQNNAHHKIGWVMTWLALGWAISGVVLNLVGAWRTKEQHKRMEFPHTSVQSMARYQDGQDGQHKLDNYRWSHDSGRESERNTDAHSFINSRSSSLNSGSTLQASAQHSQEDLPHHDTEEELAEGEKIGFLSDKQTASLARRLVPRVASRRSVLAIKIPYVVLERTLIILGLFGITSGIVTYGGIFQGNEFFSGLAHFVKGGIFFCYGLLTFGRWMGCFADFGWAWNIKPGADIVGKHIAWIPSAEFTESFVIWLYGVTNVWMEHMGERTNNEWSATDMEHISITILFFGGGMLGMLVDSSYVRDLLDGLSKPETKTNPERWQPQKHFIHPLNPLPALTIMLMGIMMSSHTQSSMVSSMMHKYWGQLFVAFAVARGFTYIILWLKPPTSYLPSRPPTEIIASFCLISGGLLFMGSNSDTVAALEHSGLHAMFVWTLVMSFVAMLMAWQVVLIVIKNWAVRHEASKSESPSRDVSVA